MVKKDPLFDTLVKGQGHSEHCVYSLSCQAGGLLLPDSIIHPVVSVSALTCIWFTAFVIFKLFLLHITAIEIVQFLNDLIIIKGNGLLLKTYVTLT